MELSLSKEDRERLEKRVAAAERYTGAQLVIAVVRRSDAYPELPWMAFALGASVAGLAVAAEELLFASWVPRAALAAVAAVLGTGAALALATVLAPWFARLFLSSLRAQTEVRQYAESLFRRKRLSGTASRTAVLLLVSLFERQVVLLPDTHSKPRLSDDELRAIAVAVAARLRTGDLGGALDAGLERLEQALGAAAATGADELPDRLIEERGA